MMMSSMYRHFRINQADLLVSVLRDHDLRNGAGSPSRVVPFTASTRHPTVHEHQREQCDRDYGSRENDEDHVEFVHIQSIFRLHSAHDISNLRR